MRSACAHGNTPLMNDTLEASSAARTSSVQDVNAQHFCDHSDSLIHVLCMYLLYITSAILLVPLQDGTSDVQEVHAQQKHGPMSLALELCHCFTPRHPQPGTRTTPCASGTQPSQVCLHAGQPGSQSVHDHLRHWAGKQCALGAHPLFFESVIDSVI
jgi:hypothetical protein